MYTVLSFTLFPQAKKDAKSACSKEKYTILYSQGRTSFCLLKPSCVLTDLVFFLLGGGFKHGKTGVL